MTWDLPVDRHHALRMVTAVELTRMGERMSLLLAPLYALLPWAASRDDAARKRSAR